MPQSTPDLSAESQWSDLLSLVRKVVGGGEALVLLGGSLALRLEKGMLQDSLRGRIAWWLEHRHWSQTAWLQILGLSLLLGKYLGQIINLDVSQFP